MCGLNKLKYLNLKELELLNMFGCNYYFMLEYIGYGNNLKKFDGYSYVGVYEDYPTPFIVLRKAGFDPAIPIFDILLLLRRLNSGIYKKLNIQHRRIRPGRFDIDLDYELFFSAIKDYRLHANYSDNIMQLKEFNMYGGVAQDGTCLDAIDCLRDLALEIDYSYESPIELPDTKYKAGISDRYRKVLHKNFNKAGCTGYYDTWGILVTSKTEESTLCTLMSGYNSNISDINKISNENGYILSNDRRLQYSDWKWYIAQINPKGIMTDSVKDILDDLEIQLSMSKIAGVVIAGLGDYVVQPKKSTYLFEDLDRVRCNIIHTSFGMLAIKFKLASYTSNINQVTNSIGNDICIKEVDTGGTPDGIIDITKTGIDICSMCMLYLNRHFLEKAYTPIHLLEVTDGGICGNVVRLIFNEFELYLDSNVIAYLQHKINVVDWVTDTNRVEQVLFDRLVSLGDEEW